jgi:hypothetical protein
VERFGQAVRDLLHTREGWKQNIAEKNIPDEMIQ